MTQFSQIDRRTMIRTTAATAVLGHHALTQQSTMAADALLSIVDTHQHLWDLEKFHLRWLKEAPEVLRRSYLYDDYRNAVEGLNVTKCVYMEVDVVPSQQLDEANFVVALSNDSSNRTVAGVISGRCEREEFDAYITRFRDQPSIKGVRHLLQSEPPGYCLQPTFIRSVQRLGELGMSFDLTIKPTELDDGLQLVQQCPETRFVVDHCGVADPKAFMKNPGSVEPSHQADAWRKSMARLADQENTICKISGIVAQAPPGWQTEHLAPIVNHCLDVFGPERVVFGGDWPVCLLGAKFDRWVGSLKEIVSERPHTEQQNLFSENAIRFYKL